ncbi:type VI secretion system Vgr family protein [Paraburkholderia caballeronis]|uniref:Type VI secretion system secreted protein VgrG n=1 Tax=Paraburkholderia caballeronis TaxID=416943 RepID=A0A1H7FKB0_9BURK|nr:type VI secretion system tip protein TssI/VgrG [Paraburkholderia caballeronis]PXW24942.1 type VI secretion system secreted protein VgrG [Paraburkholderia caballeronis]PXX00672.1 type VI secretion system secreted protein VgrG [Paraburkholderia caballeronis]RAJ98735.1 type VI secretion system secreted protein VgrG [Paraburkholderia caballeronis]SEE71318.1 type VI secretion system secreted protein VgrG [Paraburkholderia caballeronis]SEK26536.1 type VI secretion system secreted protein VgrG [Pa
MSDNLLENTVLQRRTVTVSSAAMPQLLGRPALEFMSLSGEERLGRLFEYELLLRTPDDYSVPLAISANVDLKALPGKEMTVTIELDGMGEGALGGVGAGTREISGLISDAQYLRRENRYNVYRVVLRPWLWLATLTTDYKIFQDKTVIEILDEVLKDYPYPVEKRLDVARYGVHGESGRNEPRAFQVQYGESDFTFVQRLMEEWGIYWFFEHSDGKHRLVLCDHVGAHRKPDSAEYQQLAYLPQGGKIDTEYLSEFTTGESLCSGRYLTSDFDFTRSRADLRSINQQPRDTSWNTLEYYEWPGDYTDGPHGELLARTRMEALRAPGTRALGKGNVRGLACGQTFVLTGYDYTDANREYLVLASKLELTGIADETGGDAEYTCLSAFDLQPTSEVFRLPRETPKPTVSGPQSAIVVGPPGSELWTDEFGRVKIRFTWDRYGRNLETDSCWVRVSQAWAGANFGGIYIPRVGQEVIVDFWNGDPDRPLITGSLYNTLTPPPWELPANATQSGFMSRTIEGGLENFNSIRFEDKTGVEEFMIQAENTMNRLTKVNEAHVVGVDYTIGVGGMHGVTVGGLFSSCVGGAATYAVGGAQSTMVGGADYTTVGGVAGLTVGGAYTVSVGEMISIVCGKSSLTMTKDGVIKLIGNQVRIQGGDEVVVQGSPLKLNPGDSDLGGVIATVVNTVAALPPVVVSALGVAPKIPALPIIIPDLTLPTVPPPPTTETPPPTTETPPPTTETPPPTTETPPPTTETPPPTTETPPPTTETPPPTTETPPPTTETPPPTTEPPPPPTTEPPDESWNPWS